MFSDQSANYANGHYNGGLDQHQSKELGRLISASRKKNQVLHSLLHNRCQFCVSSFPSTGCRNCCLPICQEFKKVSTKKLIRNTAHNIVNGNQNNQAYNLRKAIRPIGGGQLGPWPYELAGDPNAVRSPSPRLSPSPSTRLASTPINRSDTDSSSPSSASPFLSSVLESSAISTGNDLPLDKMSLLEKNACSVINDSELPDSPSAPSPGLVLFNNEEEADLIFLVGNDDNKPWRFPAHRLILQSSSPFFKAISLTPDENREIRVNWCDPDTFHQILKYIYTNEVAIKSVGAALLLFNAANSFRLLRLSELCLTFLYNSCNDENVLEIMAYFHSYLKQCYELGELKQNENKTTTFVEENNENENLLQMLSVLIHRCNKVLDFNASKIISSEEFAILNAELVRTILWRDTLNVTELEIFAAINHWACQQCKKTCKELTDKNKREILSDLLFYCRYLTMTEDEFLKGPNITEILTAEEKQILLDKIRSYRDQSDESCELPKHMQGCKMDVKRQYEISFSSDDDEDDDETSGSSGRGTPDDAKGDDANKSVGKSNLNGQRRKKKKKSKSKKILNGLGEVVLCVIKLLD